MDNPTRISINLRNYFQELMMLNKCHFLLQWHLLVTIFLLNNALDKNCSGKNLTELIESCEDNRKRCATDRNTENIILEETSSIQQQSKRSRYSHNYEYDTNRGNPSLSQSNDGIEIISQLQGNLFFNSHRNISPTVRIAVLETNTRVFKYLNHYNSDLHNLIEQMGKRNRPTRYI